MSIKDHPNKMFYRLHDESKRSASKSYRNEQDVKHQGYKPDKKPVKVLLSDAEELKPSLLRVKRRSALSSHEGYRHFTY